ncbi:MAG: cell division protein FtsQ/DivIB [Elusimicrobiales bacterium]
MEYNISAMAAAKKYRVKVRLKVRNRFLRTAGTAVCSAAAAAALVYAGAGAARLAFSRPLGRLFSFTLKSVSVQSPSEEISAEVSRRMDRRLGGPFSSGDARLFAADLKQDYPALSRVEVDRSFVTGRVRVRAESERMVAKVRVNGGDGRYLSENGRLLKEYYGAGPADTFETDIYTSSSGAGLAAFAGFIKELRDVSPEFSSRPVKLEYLEAPRSCRLTLENSAEVLWGEFEFTRTKVTRLNEVLSDAASKLRGPLKIDLRYFRDGKVFVSKLPHI